MSLTHLDNQGRNSGPDRETRRSSAISRVFGWLLGWAMLLGVLAVGVGAWGWYNFTATGPNQQSATVMIAKGLSRPQISRLLQDKGIISDARILSAAAAANALRGRYIRPGEYKFEPGVSIRDVLAILQSGRTVTYKITIPEGWTSEMAVLRLRENDVLQGDISAVPPEGTVIASTINFERGNAREEILRKLREAQTQLIDEIWSRKPANSLLKSKAEMVTLASIVEKETGKADERPIIAAVFLNRLRAGIKLQSDPTIIYGLVGGKGKLDRPLTRADIDGSTPYNTYVIAGLPPGPIATPGRASLEAVINPATVDFIYFVADGTGGHAFAKTLEEHNANVAKWRKLENADPATAPEPAPVQQKTQEALSAVQLETPTADPAPAAAAEPATPVTVAVPAAMEDLPVLDLKPGSIIKVGAKLIPVPAERALKR